MMSRRRFALATVAVLAMLIVVGGIVVARRSDDRLISRPWTRSEISEDGRQLTLWVEKPGDPDCEVFDHIEVSRTSDRTATAAAWYERTDQEFCIVPCPLIDEPQSVTLDVPLTDVAIGHAPSKRSCR
jgi:hypothetical protein